MPFPISQPLGDESSPFYGRLPLKISGDIFAELIVKGGVVDGRSGGLVLGRTHAEGNVYIMMREGDGFSIECCLEGGEYIVNKYSVNEHRAELEEINSRKGEEFVSHLTITPFLRVFSCRAEPFDKVLLVDPNQFIINRHATKVHLERLIELDMSSNLYLSQNLNIYLMGQKGLEDEEK